MLDLNSFTAMANNITPKTLRKTAIPPLPKIRSIKTDDFNTMYTNIIFTMMATTMF
jgi:hypothetical protein